MVNAVLHNVTVLEYGTDLSGAFCARLLGDLGAEVIKVESPSGDPARFEGEHFASSPVYLYTNANKLGVTLNVHSSTGTKILKQLIKRSDVLIESTPPGFLAGVGISQKDLRSENPSLIILSLTPFGQTGPHAHYKAYPLNIFHSAGEGYVMPSTKIDLQKPPLKLGANISEYDCGVSGANAVLAALFHKIYTGKGEHIDLSKQEALLQMTRPEIDSYPNLNTVETRATRVYPFGGIMLCKDGYEEVIIFQEEQWQSLLEIMGNPRWAEDDKFKDAQSRADNAPELNGHISGWLSTLSKEDLYHLAQSKGLPFAPVYTIKEVMGQPQYAARNTFTKLKHPKGSHAIYPTPPYHFSKTPVELRTAAPVLGQDNEEIFCNRLGYPKEILPLLRRTGCI